MDMVGLLIGSDDPKRLVDFYAKLFGKPDFDEGGYSGWGSSAGWITIGPHDEVKGTNKEPGRLIWGVSSTDVRGDFDRFVAAGATVVREPYNPGAPEEGPEMLIATFADPDGNYFQLMSPMQM
jgi:predicted enzyme related to lactoylglutathione lyase